LNVVSFGDALVVAAAVKVPSYENAHEVLKSMIKATREWRALVKAGKGSGEVQARTCYSDDLDVLVDALDASEKQNEEEAKKARAATEAADRARKGILSEMTNTRKSLQTDFKHNDVAVDSPCSSSSSFLRLSLLLLSMLLWSMASRTLPLLP
jgi:hypothetical protein